jgi:hypothetical protein
MKQSNREKSNKFKLVGGVNIRDLIGLDDDEIKILKEILNRKNSNKSNLTLKNSSNSSNDGTATLSRKSSTRQSSRKSSTRQSSRKSSKMQSSTRQSSTNQNRTYNPNVKKLIKKFENLNVIRYSRTRKTSQIPDLNNLNKLIDPKFQEYLEKFLENNTIINQNNKGEDNITLNFKDNGCMEMKEEKDKNLCDLLFINIYMAFKKKINDVNFNFFEDDNNNNYSITINNITQLIDENIKSYSVNKNSTREYTGRKKIKDIDLLLIKFYINLFELLEKYKKYKKSKKSKKSSKKQSIRNPIQIGGIVFGIGAIFAALIVGGIVVGILQLLKEQIHPNTINQMTTEFYSSGDGRIPLHQSEEERNQQLQARQERERKEAENKKWDVYDDIFSLRVTSLFNVLISHLRSPNNYIKKSINQEDINNINIIKKLHEKSKPEIFKLVKTIIEKEKTLEDQINKENITEEDKNKIIKVSCKDIKKTENKFFLEHYNKLKEFYDDLVKNNIINEIPELIQKIINEHNNMCGTKTNQINCKQLEQKIVSPDYFKCKKVKPIKNTSKTTKV